MLFSSERPRVPDHHPSPLYIGGGGGAGTRTQGHTDTLAHALVSL